MAHDSPCASLGSIVDDWDSFGHFEMTQKLLAKARNIQSVWRQWQFFTGAIVIDSSWRLGIIFDDWHFSRTCITRKSSLCEVVLSVARDDQLCLSYIRSAIRTSLCDMLYLALKHTSASWQVSFISYDIEMTAYAKICDWWRSKIDASLVLNTAFVFLL